MASRPIKDEELSALADAGDMRSPRAEHTIAMDGLAVLVHRDNPLSQLTTGQIAGLFSGEIRNWRELGGRDAPVSLYARDDKSGTWDTFAGLVLGKRLLSPAARRFESNDALSDAVAADPNGIGFSGLASVRRTKALAVADGGGRAILPTRLSVATEDYPLARRLYLYLRPDQGQGDALALIEHCQSEKGQDVVEEVGFVSQNIIELAQEEADNSPLAYRELSRSAHRLSVNFRFHQGSAALDNKARRDLRRLIDYMDQPPQQGRHLYLVGFNDGDGNGRWEQLISRFRALAVQAELMKSGITVHRMIGLGAFLPVAAAGNGNAAAKNGRVEAWISPAPAAAPDTSASGR
jgi:phosphate transport system substrate-binding protein